ncbi:TRAP-type mannitol/chloroaromatic compound transport system permease small subunit [Homoserinimonas aerilata]|uniref:TRAP-type mannitol/chloroaromatic compound transport system permease small subunit n=1 Tax=Homoserinimonas aerilata TaxID=1162970 RepID=A0A542YF92_9MICO|nr:TRAP transporter small permease [Homoserinimonas aerilata]TQL46763.1 TRAP-type mannitol/chloroaromatic compound transport system permease small subunit [Homoserinimonas aerilata]
MFVVSLWERGLRPAAKWFAVASAVLCGALALLLTAEVVMRGTSGTSIRGLFEIAELGLVMTVFLGLAQSEVNGTHVRVTLLTDRLSPAAANRMRGIALILATVFLAWMGFELVERALQSFTVGEYRTGLLNFPVWPSRAFVAVGTVFLALVLFVKGLVHLTGRTPSGATDHTEGGAV